MLNKSQLSRRLAIIICLACCFMFAIQPQVQAKAVEAVVVVEKMEVRDSSGNVLGYLKKGTQVTVHSYSGKIARILYKGQKGLAQLSDLEKIEAEKATPVAPTEKPKKTPKPTAPQRPTKTPKTSVTPRPTKTPKPSLSPKPTKTAKPTASAKATPTPKPNGKTEVIMVDGTKAYSKADTASKVYGTLESGDRVQVVDARGNWVKVKAHGKTCFVKKNSFIAPTVTSTPIPTAKPTSSPTERPSSPPEPTAKPTATPTKKPDSPSGTKADRVISAAKAHLGKPYIYATSGPNSFDCSGLTCYAYGTVGVYLPRTANQQGYASSERLSKSQLQRGDMVFFNTVADSDLCDHVGIYLGSNQFIHASSGAHKVVISSLTGYYATAFSWGRRIL